MTDAPMPAGYGRPLPIFRAWKAFLAFLKAPTTVLIAGGLLLPNLLSLATLGSFVDIGLPPRTAAIILLCLPSPSPARRIPFALTRCCSCAILAFDMVRTISLMFGLAPTELLAALDQARRIHFFASPLYFALISAVRRPTARLAVLPEPAGKAPDRQHLCAVRLGCSSSPRLDFVTNVPAQLPVRIGVRAQRSGGVGGGSLRLQSRRRHRRQKRRRRHRRRPRLHARSESAPANCRAALRSGHREGLCRDRGPHRLLRLDHVRRNARALRHAHVSIPTTSTNTVIRACRICWTGAAIPA